MQTSYIFYAFLLEEAPECVILCSIEVETAYMINEEKVILMTRASLYEEKQKKKALKISKYFRHDYISVQLLAGWFFVTLCFLLAAVLWGACHMEYLMENLHKMDIQGFGLLVLAFYVVTVVVYLSVLYGVSSYRYSRAKRSVSEYMQTLQKISDIYEKEDSGETTEDTDGGKES